MDKRKFRLAVVTPVVTALVVVTVVLYLILQGAANRPAEEGVTYSPDMAAVALPQDEGTSEETNAETNAETTEETGAAACDFDQWLGKEVDESAVKETGRIYRLLPPNSVATMDFNPERINVMVDDKNIVTAVRCG